MSQAMYTAASGIANAQTQINVVSNNIANMNTTAFKQSAVTFSDVFYSTISNGSPSTIATGGVNPKEVGYGAQVAAISTDFTTGTFQDGKETDMMITGVGYFTVQSSAGEILYTRAGNFSLDSEGYLVMANGYKVLGTDNVSGASASQTPIKIPTSMNSVLTASEKGYLGTKALADLNGIKSISTGDFKINVTTSEGTTELTVEIVASDNLNTIKGKIADALETVTAGGDALVEGTDFNVGLNDDGQFFIEVLELADPDDQKITSLLLEDGDSSFLKNTGLSNVIALPGDTYKSYVLDYQMTGTPASGNNNDISYKSMDVDENGAIEITFDNGDKLTVVQKEGLNEVKFHYKTSSGITIKGNDIHINKNVVTEGNLQLQMATFINQEGLKQVGSNLYELGANSGPAIYGVANSNGIGAIKGGGYESSNVDLTKQFASMIIAQRAVEANSRVFDTANQIMKSLAYLGQ